MRRLVIYFLFLALMVSCKTTKKIVENEVVIHETEKENVKEDKKETSESFIKTIDALNENTTAHIVIYDTSAPIDSATGKHPIKAEIDIEKNTNKTTDVETETKEESDVHVEKECEKDKNYTQETHSEEYRKNDKFVYVKLISLGLIVVLLFIFGIKIIKK